MKAVILCAGKGTRLRPYTNTKPKCLVEILDKPILYYQIKALRSCGINEIIIVAGYLHHLISEYCDNQCKIILNKLFEATNSIYSLWLTKEEVVGSSFILINGDIVFDEALIKPLIECKHETAVIVDQKRQLVEGEMNVVITNGRIEKFSKSIPVVEADAQSLQIVKIGADDSKLLFSTLDKKITNGCINEFSASAYAPFLKNSSMFPVYYSGGIWCEIDDEKDLINCATVLKKE